MIHVTTRIHLNSLATFSVTSCYHYCHWHGYVSFLGFMCYVLLNNCTFQSAVLPLRTASTVELPNLAAWWRWGCSSPMPPDRTSSRAKRVFPVGSCHSQEQHTSMDTYGWAHKIHRHTQHFTRSQTAPALSPWAPPADQDGGLPVGVHTCTHKCPSWFLWQVGSDTESLQVLPWSLTPPQLLAPAHRSSCARLIFLQRLLSLLAGGGRVSTLIYKDYRCMAWLLTNLFSVTPVAHPVSTVSQFHLTPSEGESILRRHQDTAALWD